jgi:hypothetical protein
MGRRALHMRMGLLAVWIVAALVAWPQLAYAGVPTIDKDGRALKKYAVEDVGSAGFLAKARGLCVCLNDSQTAYEDKMGILVFERVVETIGAQLVRDLLQVRCRVFGYSQSTGERDVFKECDDWISLAK